MRAQSPLSSLYAGVFVLCVVCWYPSAHGQEAISTERPSFSNSSSVLVPGRLNVETGFQYQRTDDSLEELLLNTTQLRYGVSEFFELRMFWNLQQADAQVEGANLSGTGFAPLGLGFKMKVLEGQGWIPQTAFIAEISLRGGTDIFKSERVVPALRYSMGWSIGEKGSLTHTYNMFWSEGTDRVTNLLTLIYSHGLTDDLTGFMEVYSFHTKGSNDYRMDAGLIYLIAPRFQVDLSGGVGLSDISPDWFVDTGLSFALFK